jgi:hypothetical protein
MQQDREFSCGGHDGSLLAVLAAAFGQLQSPSSQITLSSNGPRMSADFGELSRELRV